MKNIIKTFGIIALATVIGFSMIACGDGGGGDDTPTPAELAAKLAADINNAINASKSHPYYFDGSGRADADGATVRIIGGFAGIADINITVPNGVTLDVTEGGAAIGLHNATLTVNGTVNAGSNHVRLEDNANWAVINGSGTVNLKGKGYLFDVHGNHNVATRRLTIDGVTLVGVADNSEALVGIGQGGEFVLKSGKISGNGNTGVNMWSGGKFTMEGGSITGNHDKNHGGVRVGGGSTFTMEGGTISGNSGEHGGGVAVFESTLIMKGGTISGNTSLYDSGGVFLHDNGIFTMYGGTVYGSKATAGDALGNTVTQNDGAAALFILNNTTAKYGDGGNILPHTDGKADRTDYTITGKS